jgi:putative oxidoreductase
VHFCTLILHISRLPLQARTPYIRGKETVMLNRLLARHAPLGPLALRLALGAVFLAHAYAKAFVYTFPGTVQFFAASGFPGWTAYPVFAAELLGGLALIVGFRTREVAVLLIPVMLGALETHAGNGWMFTSAGGGWEYVAFLIGALGAQAFAGAGAFALTARATTSHGPADTAAPRPSRQQLADARLTQG